MHLVWFRERGCGLLRRVRFFASLRMTVEGAACAHWIIRHFELETLFSIVRPREHRNVLYYVRWRSYERAATPSATSDCELRAERVWVDQEAAGARALVGEGVFRVEEDAGVERKATAANAAGELVTQLLHLLDAQVELSAPAIRKLLPVGLAGRASGGELVERGSDLGKRHSNPLRNADEGDPAQGVPAVAPLISIGAATGDEPLPLVKVERGNRNAA